MYVLAPTSSQGYQLTTDLLIRNYESQDLLQCRALWGQLTERHREIYQDPRIGGETPEFKFDEHLAASGSEQIWVAIEGQKVVGLVGMVVKGNEAEVEPRKQTENALICYRHHGI